MALAGFADAEGEWPKPVPPEIVKQLQTPANVSVDSTTLRYDGIIIDVSIAEVERLLQTAKASPIRSMVIKSRGGTGDEGIRFGELVRDWKLAVTVDSYCMSACANYVAIAARELVVPDGALLGYHGGEPKRWGDDGKYLEKYEKQRLATGFNNDKFLAEQLQRDKELYARQEALFQSAGVSTAILEDTAAAKIAPASLWMFTREALESCYNMKNIKQYPTLSGDQILQGKSFIKIVRDCPSKAH